MAANSAIGGFLGSSAWSVLLRARWYHYRYFWKVDVPCIPTCAFVGAYAFAWDQTRLTGEGNIGGLA